ncbi:MAG: shikimate kinase [Paludibacteraceae bacterium]|nr:shikimate kinase [Paludibacteraceae bacterium]
MRNIFLVGFMGSGKTTIGHMLSKELGCSFIDLDCYIENRYLKKISEIFSEQGEQKFREIEHRLLKEVAEMDNVIISTGGGAACFFNNMQIMNQHGVSIYLQSTPEKLAARLLSARNTRPLIKNITKEELPLFIRKKLTEREPYYNQSTYIVQNNDDNPEPVSKKIKEFLSSRID